jgi:hypothetical protein
MDSQSIDLQGIDRLLDRVTELFPSSGTGDLSAIMNHIERKKMVDASVLHEYTADVQATTAQDQETLSQAGTAAGEEDSFTDVN